MSPAPGTLTIGEVVAAISHLARDPAGLLERARHWGRLGLLTATDRVHAGVGRHALYPKSAIIDAALICTLAETGLPIASQRWMAEAQTQTRQAFAEWQSKQARGRMYLEVFFIPGGKYYIDLHRGRPTSLKQVASRSAVKPDEARAILSIRVDLGMLFESIFEITTITTSEQQARAIDEGRRATAKVGARGSTKNRGRRG